MAVIQFDNLVVEAIVYDTMYNIYNAIQNSNTVHCFKIRDIYEMRELVNYKEEDMSFESFRIEKSKPLCRKAIECISEIM